MAYPNFLIRKTSFVRLLMGYHSNADNKFMDDHKTDISFEGKNGSKKEY